MKKIILLGFIFILSCVLYGETYNLSNKNMNISLEISKENIYIKSINDLKNNVNFIKDSKDTPLWSFVCKKEIQGEEIVLYPSLAEDFKIENNNTSIKATWINVKEKNMSQGFDVVVNINLKDTDTLWDIEISPNKDFYIWTVKFPYISNLDSQDGDEFLFPIRSKLVYDKFSDERGFEIDLSRSEKRGRYSKDIGFFSPIGHEFISLTKNNSTLYMCPQDKWNNLKTTNATLFSPNKMDIIINNYPSVEKNIGYKLPYTYNISLVKGDWYNACKRYRKWCINANYGPFANGPLETRKDLPNWFKDNPFWLTWHWGQKEGLDKTIEIQKTLDVPCACHVYDISSYPFDTNYPAWLPGIPENVEYLKELRKNNIPVMPYTNGIIVDINNNKYYKEYGDKMVLLDEKGQRRETPFLGNDKSAHNVHVCPDTCYSNIYSKEIVNMMNEWGFDALYMDQVGCTDARDCFNKDHSHKMGGGDFYVKNYTNLINDLRIKLKKANNEEPVPFACEGETDSFPYDLWLRIDNSGGNIIDHPEMHAYVCSGYGISFGSSFIEKEWITDEAKPAILKLAKAWVNGIEPAWIEDYNKFLNTPKFLEYTKNLAKCRYEIRKYNTFGEMVRPVRLNNVPLEKIKWYHNSDEYENEFPTVLTMSYNYNGKTCVVFTNISFNDVKFNWSSDFESLNLSKKSTYKINEFYPNKTKAKSIKNISGKVNIKPLETIAYIIE